MARKYYDPFTDEIRVEYADRHVWFNKLKRDFLKVVNYYVKWSDNWYCIVCKRTHSSESALRNCLFYHVRDTINHFIDHELIEASS